MLLGRKNKDSKNRELGIIIIGCGKVGSALTELLYGEGHDVTLIDVDADRLQILTDKYDVMGIVGNGASYNVQKEAGVETADLIIAVTDLDELNLLCCTVAKRSGKCAAIARVRMPEYSAEIPYLKEKLDLAMIINPEQVAAKEIARMLSLPAAMEVNSFAHGAVEMIRFRINDGNRLDGMSLARLGKEIESDMLVCAVERGGQITIPDGSFVLQASDTVSFISSMKVARDFFMKIGYKSFQIRRTMIIGGGKAAYYLSRKLLENGIGVKIIERDRERCAQLSDMLPEAAIICGDGTDEELLKEEGIESIDGFIPLTGLDEENVLLTLHAADVSDAKVITKIKRNTFRNVINKLELGSVVYPQYITAEVIAAYVRGLSATKENDNLETLYRLFNNRVEAIEFSVSAASRATGIQLKDLKTKPNLLIAAIIRHGIPLIPGGHDSIEVGDNVIIVTTNLGMKNLDDILA